MPPSISLVGLTWRMPGSASLFENLDLTFGIERTGIVGRNGTGKSTLLRLMAGDLKPTAGNVSIAGSVAMMRQRIPQRPDDTVADLFGLRGALDILARAQAGSADAHDLANADWTLPSRMDNALTRCGLSTMPETVLATLSGGQLSRAVLASLLFAQPDFLLLDEPTNDLDTAGRQAIIDLIREWKRGIIIVSHDRALLEGMDVIVELTSLGAKRYGGSYSEFRRHKETELRAAGRALAHAELAEAATARRAQQAVERKARKDGAGRRARGKGGQAKIMLDAAKERSEASGGAGVRLREARRQETAADLAAARARIEVLQPLRMDIPATGLSNAKSVLRLDHVTFSHDARHPTIRDLSLAITGPERILVAGPNGSGKTTLLQIVTGRLEPQRGTVHMAVPFAFLDQQVCLLDAGCSLCDNFIRLNPASTVQSAHASLARFGFRAMDGLKLADALSGGERLRAGLACVLGATPPPMLLILDEPTNHLDLDGIAALEAALAAYDGAVLAVSHDEAFVQALAPSRTIRL